MMQFDQQLGDGQSQPCSLGPLGGGGCAIERLENLVSVIWSDAGSDITHGDPNFIGGYFHDGQVDNCAHGREFDRIVKKIEEDLSQFVGVGTDKGQIGRQRDHDAHAAFGAERVKIFDGFGDQASERHRFQTRGRLVHLDLGEI